MSKLKRTNGQEQLIHLMYAEREHEVGPVLFVKLEMFVKRDASKISESFKFVNNVRRENKAKEEHTRQSVQVRA